jgi:hypothetical protein
VPSSLPSRELAWPNLITRKVALMDAEQIRFDDCAELLLICSGKVGGTPLCDVSSGRASI